MKRVMLTGGLIMALLAIAVPSSAVMYIWKDADGNTNATDQLYKVPAHFQDVVKYDTDHYVNPAGIGFERDGRGNVHFFDHSSPAKKVTRRAPPGDFAGPPGSPVTESQLAEVKRRYQVWGKEPRPQVEDAKVRRIISGDTFELENGQKVTFIGIEFPDELKGDTPIHQEAIEFQRKLMEGKRVHMLYGPQRFDDRGRLLAFVFIGTDMFVNAELIMNGYARVKTVPPNTEYRKLFLRLEEFAKDSQLGMWDAGDDEIEE